MSAFQRFSFCPLMTILGINAYHGDSAACLVRDGQLVAAAAEERFRRVKHWAGLPTEAIAWCLREGGTRFGDLDHIAINRKPGVNNWRRLLFVMRYRPDFGLVVSKLRNIRHAASIEEILGRAFPGQPLRASVHHVEHHLAHLGSAFLLSPFEEAVCLSVDGFGDFASAAWGMGRRATTGPRDHKSTGGIGIDGRIYFPHSLGIFYSAITQLIGFPHFGDEYKVMGLAPYGEPKYIAQMRQVVRVKTDGTFELDLRFFRHHTDNVTYSWRDCAPEVGTLYAPALEELLGPTRKHGEPLEQKHKDLARSAQALYEEAFFALLNALFQKYQCPSLAVSGGCAMNSVANGKVYLQTPFKRMYLPAAAGDAGGAIGAAFVVWQQLDRANAETLKSGKAEMPSGSTAGNGHFVMAHAYTGPQFDDAEIEKLLESRGLLKVNAETLKCGKAEISSGTVTLDSQLSTGAPQAASLSASGGEGRGEVAFSLSTLNPQPSTEFTVTHHRNSADLCERTAKAIADGQVVGWFQGRMEWGPRALGNRSILCDPRRADMKAILNAKIKRRESFRPFAPSILREHVNEWFEQDDAVPFMMSVFKFRADKRPLLPAVCHVDGSGRLQTVHQDTNPLYHRLISDFCSLTSVPMVLNTSFNENEPVVCKPEEALDCFLRTKMDVLVLGNFFVERKPNAERLAEANGAMLKLGEGKK